MSPAEDRTIRILVNQWGWEPRRAKDVFKYGGNGPPDWPFDEKEQGELQAARIAATKPVSP